MIDLRNQEDSVINDSLLKYNFLCFKRDLGDRFAYLILNDLAFPNIIENREAVEETCYKELFVPRIESWYPESLGLDMIAEVLDITIKRRPMTDFEKAIREVEKANRDAINGRKKR